MKRKNMEDAGFFTIESQHFGNAFGIGNILNYVVRK
jgi:hypothetical protein